MIVEHPASLTAAIVMFVIVSIPLFVVSKVGRKLKM